MKSKPLRTRVQSDQAVRAMVLAKNEEGKGQRAKKKHADGGLFAGLMFSLSRL